MASRKTMNISLPPAMKKWVDQQVKERGFGTASEFVRHVLRTQWEECERETLEAKLLQGIESGPVTHMTAAEWEAIRREGRERVESARSRSSRRSRKSA